MPEEVGRIQSIWRFPIKSFQGESVERAELGATGIFGDRALALRNRETGKIVSGKEAKLGDRVLAFEARFASEPVSGQPLPQIEAVVAGKAVTLEDAAAFSAACSEALGEPVELVTAGDEPATYESDWPEIEDLPIAGATLDFPLALAEAGSFVDVDPIHFLTTASLAKLGEAAPEGEIAVSRFRPSFVIDTGEASGYVEHDWEGRAARLGEARLELGNATPRCIMTTRAQAGLPKDPGVLKAIVRENRREFMGLPMPSLGIYAKVVAPGAIRVGDALTLD